MLTKIIVALQKNRIVATNEGIDNRIAASTVQAHLMSLGYMLSEDAWTALSYSDLSYIKQFHDEAITYLRSVLGGARNYTALYRNFPEEVMSLSDSQLYMNAVRHYWSNGSWSPSTPELEKSIKFEKIKYTLIENISEDEFDTIFTDLVSINTSLTPSDLKIVKWFATSGRTLKFPSSIPFKENLCTLAALGIDVPVKTVTDVLRIAVHLSGGDISLPAVPAALVKTNRWSSVKSANPERAAFRFKKFKRKERRLILSLLEKTNCDSKEMVLRKERWLRLGEILHPGEFKDSFPKSFKAFNAIRNEKVVSWYGLVEKGFRKSYEDGLSILSQRGGEYARRLDFLVRKNPSKIELTMKYFREAVKDSSNKVLFEVYDHFIKRDKVVTDRSVFVKGARSKTILPNLPAISKSNIDVITQVVFESLTEKFSKLPALGNCWIDEELKKIPLPTNMRSMNFSTKPTIRGTRIPFGNSDTKVIRAFVHWFDKNGTEDLDLSATFIGKKTSVLSYSGLRVGKSCHSGDVLRRQGPCAEYIDIDIADALSCGYKYVSIDVRNFRGGSLKSVESMFGMMEREFPESNKHWLPETVSMAQSLESSSTVTLIAVLDLEAREYVMLDIDSNSSPVARGNVADTEKAISAYMKNPDLSVWHLVKMHVDARGKEVDLTHNIDTYFKFEDFANSYETTGKLML